MNDFDQVIKNLIAERYRPSPKPAWMVDTPEVCAARLQALEDAVRGFVFTPAAVRRKQKLRAHQNRKAREAKVSKKEPALAGEVDHEQG